MPTIVIHALNQEPKKASYSQTEVSVGREADNDLALPGKTVSRHHATFLRTPEGWVARCVSETNPLVVDGAMTRTEVEVVEGSEVLVGGDYLLVFVENEKNAANYMGGEKKYYTRVACERCGWAGLMSGVRAQPVCPGCGNTDLARGDAYDHTKEADKAQAGATAFVDQPGQGGDGPAQDRQDEPHRAVRRQVGRGVPQGAHRTGHAGDQQGHHHRAQAVRDRVRRGHQDLVERQELPGRVHALLPLDEGKGTKESTCLLKNGDLIEVGSNRFKFVTE